MTSHEYFKYARSVFKLVWEGDKKRRNDGWEGSEKTRRGREGKEEEREEEEERWEGD